MKNPATQLSILLTFIVLLTTSSGYSQEYDDIYFRKKDRVKIENFEDKKELEPSENDKQDQSLDKATNPDQLAYSDTLEEGISDEQYFEEDYVAQSPNQSANEYMDNADVVVKHYYYGHPSTSYYGSFDDVFWSDPFLYQGTAFDPFYDPYYHNSSFYRPGWNISIRIGSGYPYYGNRWRYNSYSRYNSYYGNGWGGYYDPWYGYYDPFWCPPSYYNNRNYIVTNNEGYYNNSRGVVRGKRSSRNSNYNSDYSGSRTGRVAGNENNGRFSNGRVSSNNDSSIKTRGNGRIAGSSTNSESNYSGFRRSSENSSGYTSREESASNSNSPSRTNRSSSVESSTKRRSNNNASTYTNRSNSNSTRSTRTNSNSSQSRSSNSYGSSSKSSRSSGSSSVGRSSSSRSSSGTSRSSSGSSSKRKKD